MNANKLLHQHLTETCPDIHNIRLQSIMDVAQGLQRSQNLSLSAIGRGIDNTSKVKHKIKKVDRLESNTHLHDELGQLYRGLSSYVLTYVSHEGSTPIVVDLCYMKDDHDIQMLSAEVAIKGRSLPIYREVFKSGELKNRANEFVRNLKDCIPSDKKIVLIMDAGFGEDWLKAIESHGWYWLLRIRQGKNVQPEANGLWLEVKDFIPFIGVRAKCYKNARIMKRHNRACRIITVCKTAKTERKKPKVLPRNNKAGNDCYRRSAKEPWILATNLPSEYNTIQVINFYKKRMQIEESFRDIKSHRFGLSGRYIRTSCIKRWGVKMLLAAIVQIVLWIIGIIGHSQNFQKVFQANTVKNKKVFSYFYLGQLIIKYDKLNELKINYKELPNIIAMELAREW